MTEHRMTRARVDTEQPEVTLTEQWQTEQQNWQQLLQTYADSAAQDEKFLIHVGNAMRGSLLAGKPYPERRSNSQPETTPP